MIQVPTKARSLLTLFPDTSEIEIPESACSPSTKSSVKRYRLLCVSSPSAPKTETKPLFPIPHRISVATSLQAVRPRAPRKIIFPVIDFADDLADSNKASGLRSKRIRHTNDVFGSATQHSDERSEMAVPRIARDEEAAVPEYSISAKAHRHVNDGFTMDEQNTPPRYRERRTKNTLSEMRLKGLELTHMRPARPKFDGSTWLRGQKRHRSATTPSFRTEKQYASVSQSRMESQDPMEVDNRNHDILPEHSPTLGRTKWDSITISDDGNEEVDLLRISEQDGDDDNNVEQSDVQLTSDTNKPIDLLVAPDDDDEVSRSTFIQNGGIEPETGVGLQLTSWTDGLSGHQLPSKRMLSFDYGEEPLALRPVSRQWAR